jgi:uncharacterized protein (DUF697 family)
VIMSKKLPKAIRPNVTHQGGPEAQSRVVEPMPETKRPARPQRGSSIAPEDLLLATPATAAAASASADVVDSVDAAATKSRARKLVERFSLYSGVAGLLPVPVVDVAAVGGVQLQMLRRISQLYDVPFSKNRGKAIVASLAGTMIPASTGLGVASMAKSVPVAGTAIGAMTAPALSVGATYVIGMAFVEHFARGGTLLDFDPPDHREFIKAPAEQRKT